MAGAYQFSCTYDPRCVVMQGLCFDYNGDELLTGLGLSTFGLVYSKADIWVNLETCESLATTTETNEFAVGFTTLDSYIDFGSTGFNPDRTDPWTVCGWTKDVSDGANLFPYIVNSLGTLPPGLLIKAGNGGVHLSVDVEMQHDQMSSDLFYITYDSDVDFSTVGTQWQHVVVSCDGSGLSTGVRAYINGVLLTTVLSSFDNLSGSTVAASVIMGNVVGESPADGYLSNVGMYEGSVLTLLQVKEIFDAGRGADLTQLSTSSLLSHWYEFDGNADDSKGSANGTVVGGVQFYSVPGTTTIPFAWTNEDGDL